MKILFVTRALGYGGAERQLSVAARGLREMGHDVLVATFYGGGHFDDRLRRDGVQVEDLGKRGRWDNVSFVARFVTLLRAERPDVVYGFLSVPNVLSTLCRKAIPGSKIVWGIRASELDFGRYNWLVRLSYKLEDLLVSGADLIIVNSEAGRRDCENRGFPTEKMLVIPNGIDCVYFAPDPGGGAEFRRRIDIDPSAPLIGVVGRLDPMKGHPTFLTAFAAVVRERSSAKAVIVGEGDPDYTAELRELASALGVDQSVVWIDSYDAMPELYSGIDLLVSTSRFGEGFPNVVAEAMACETPCVVTGVGDSAVLVGDSGVVVDPADPHDLSVAILRSLDTEDLVKLGSACRERIKRSFSVQRYLESTDHALQGRYEQ